MRRARLASLAIAACCWTVGCAGESPPRLLLGTTHTLEDSGVLDVLRDAFAEAHPEHDLDVVVAGSGEILGMAAAGDLDVLFTHSPDDEIAFIAAGNGETRQPVMHNDFVILGPAADPAGVRSAENAADAMRRIEESGAPFISRGDHSGTHRMERALWAAAQSVPAWPGYAEAGTGMADVLRLAAQRNAYTLSDRATWEVLRSELALTLLHEGDERLLNQYSVIVVNTARNIEGARAFAVWIRGADAQRVIAGFGVEQTGRILFTPDAAPMTPPR